MNLSRKTWEEVWESLKRIEYYNNNSVQANSTKKVNINLEVMKIKQRIEKAAGQME